MLSLILGDSYYSKKFTCNISSENVFNFIKNKPIAVFIEANNISMSVLAPVIYRQEGNNYYLDVLFTEEFITNNLNKTCIIKN